MSVLDYKEVINIISSQLLDYKSIAIRVAKDNPSTFLRAVKAVLDEANNQEILKDGSFETKCKEIYKERGKIEAIKFTRMHKGMDLREAKGFVEKNIM